MMPPPTKPAIPPTRWGAAAPTSSPPSTQRANGATCPVLIPSKKPIRPPELSAADLHEANLFRANLFQADLAGAYLCKADLRWADLREAGLRGTEL